MHKGVIKVLREEEKKFDLQDAKQSHYPAHILREFAKLLEKQKVKLRHNQLLMQKARKNIAPLHVTSKTSHLTVTNLSLT